MVAIEKPKTLSELLQFIGQLRHEEGTMRFLLICFNLGRTPSTVGALWKACLLIGAASGWFVAHMLFTQGHAAFNTSSDGVIWGMPVAVYEFFSLSSSGLIFIASFPLVFGIKAFYPIAKRCIWLAIIALIAGLSVLAMELGHPFRMLWVIPTGLQFRSPMFWMGTFYSVYLALLLIKFYLLSREDWDSGFSRFISVVSFVATILASGTSGLVFGSMVMRPMWYGAFTPIYFMLTAALSGVAAIAVASHMAYGYDRNQMPPSLRQLVGGVAWPTFFATLIGMVLVLMLARFGVGLWSNLNGLEGFDAMARSPLFYLEVGGGLVLPFILMILPATRCQTGVQMTAASLVLAAVLAGRYEFIVGGQIVPALKGLWINPLTDL